METIYICPQKFPDHFCSYPTYEEWKHGSSAQYSPQGYSSYPTYEEWKRLLACLKISRPLSSYPTYEEWKLCSSVNSPDLSLPFLSYL